MGANGERAFEGRFRMTTSGAPAEKAASDVTIMAVVAAIGTILAAFQLFQPKFAIGLAMKRETGNVEKGYWFFYEFPLWVIAFIVFVIWVVLLLALLHQLAPGFVPVFAVTKPALDLLALQNLIPVLLLVACVASFIQLNILSWVFLWVGRGLAMLPIPELNGAFGLDGRSAGWHQAWCICRNWDKGQPLLISQENIDRLADLLLLKVANATNAGIDFADRPAKASAAAAANIALIGCIIEEAHIVNRWKSPKSWNSFYNALETIHENEGIFEPETLTNFSSGRAFSQRVRDLLAAQMTEKSEVVPEGSYFAAASYVAKAWDILESHGGSVLCIVPWHAFSPSAKVYWLNRRLSNFPLLREDGMRQQTIKLMARWDAAPWIKQASFLHPFAKGQAWLLLQESALVVLPEQKDVTFWGSGDVGIVKAACGRIFTRVIASVAEGLSTEAKSVATKYKTEWDLIAAADFVLWSWARHDANKGRDENWEATKGWRWKLNNGRASRVS
jgi:hypothetical protein